MKESVNVVLTDPDGRVLVLERSEREEWYPGVWNFPGGGVDEGESFHDAVRRETLEETGLVVEPEGGYFATYYYPDGKEENAEAAVRAFRAQIISGDIRLDLAHTDYRRVGKDDWKELQYTPSAQAVLEQLFA